MRIRSAEVRESEMACVQSLLVEFGKLSVVVYASMIHTIRPSTTLGNGSESRVSHGAAS